MPAAPRHAGLDTLRALAITLVFLYHYTIFVSEHPGFGPPGVVGWCGVDLFFVLSGYLIANPLMAGLARGERPEVSRFLARRALRTLPVYLLVVAAFFCLPGQLGGRTPPPLWRFLTFTQNLGLQPGTAFSHAWSLCVEEQFYLVLPWVLLAGWATARLRPGRGPRGGWALLVALMVLAMTLRCLRWQELAAAGPRAPQVFMTRIYYDTLCRFDEFLPGVAVAMLRHFHPAAWQAALRHGRAWGAAGLAGAVGVLAVAWSQRDLDHFGLGFTVLGYPLLAMSFAALVVAALSPRTALHRVRVPGAGPLARASYSIYLTHKPVAHVVRRLAAPMGAGPWTMLALVVVACGVAGFLAWFAMEAPFLRLRDRWVPARPPSGPAPHAATAATGEAATTPADSFTPTGDPALS